jgi:hypothetical protein
MGIELQETDIITNVGGGSRKTIQIEAARELAPQELLKPGRINDTTFLIRLYDGGLTYDEIARVFGVSKAAVNRVVTKLQLKKRVQEPQTFKSEMENKMLSKMEKILGHITEDKMSAASLQQLITAFGILYDKVRLHRGESTSNVAAVNVHKLDEASMASIKEIIKTQTQKKLLDTRKEYEND